MSASIIQTFKNDYNRTCHPHILQALAATEKDHFSGYGLDVICEKASDLIRDLCACPTAHVQFIAGGTLTNLLSIASFLRPHQAVIAADSGHIEVHETGAIEATGHKILTAHCANGKLCPEQIKTLCALHDNEHMVQAKLVYISQSTELGSVYTKAELKAIAHLCKELGLYLFMDGARLGAAIMCAEDTPSLAEIANLCDAFYIGGTKNGALFGEALVLVNEHLQHDFRYLCKQRGALLAKGWIIGAQFEALFSNNLFYDMASHANDIAKYIDAELAKLHIPLLIPTYTNQIFPILPANVARNLAKSYAFETWSKQGEGQIQGLEHTHTIRFVTSWSSSMEDADKLIDTLQSIQTHC